MEKLWGNRKAAEAEPKSSIKADETG